MLNETSHIKAFQIHILFYLKLFPLSAKNRYVRLKICLAQTVPLRCSEWQFEELRRLFSLWHRHGNTFFYLLVWSCIPDLRCAQWPRSSWPEYSSSWASWPVRRWKCSDTSNKPEAYLYESLICIQITRHRSFHLICTSTKAACCIRRWMRAPWTCQSQQRIPILPQYKGRVALARSQGLSL